MLKLTHFVTLSPAIQSLLNTLAAQQLAFDLIPTKPAVLDNFRRHSLLSSAVYSARIEGIGNHTDLDKLAVQNLLNAYTWLSRQTNPPLNLDSLRDLHRRTLHNLHAHAGQLRTEQSAVFNSAGIAIYLTPPPQEIKPLLTAWLNQISSSRLPPLIQGIISHYQFEKIHPFLDGNGRVGRLVFALLVKRGGLGLIEFLGLEQLINDSRATYYSHLEKGGRDLTDFAAYFLTLLTQAARSLLPKLATSQTDPAAHLLPRRQELLETIRDHSPCSADSLYRRFLAIPKSTLRYDLLQLQKQGLIKKLGNTRGALYSISLPE